ncbi:MAG: NAD-glutamate dehydrogenase [Acidimicrobiia bacterium]|nr:MAG: NAD-glutamate dehydrogenase [Acidimicrobiia bacterium]
MAGTEGVTAPTSSLVDRLIASIPADISAKRRAMLEPFARMYIKRLPEAEVPDLPIEQLLAEISDLLDFVDTRSAGSPAIRVFSKNDTDTGSTTPGSVVQIVSDDGPFLVDSVSAVVARSGAGIVRHLHPVIGTVRDGAGRLAAITAARGADRRESVQHFDLDRDLPDDVARALEAEIAQVLRDVTVSVRDFDAMRTAVGGMIETAKASVHHYSYEEITETVDFLTWLLDDNYVLLGYKEYVVTDSDEGRNVKARPESGLGILSENGSEQPSVLLSDLPPHLRERYMGGDLLVITKTNRHATVHRDARMDYIGIRRIDQDGSMVAELRLLGLFTSKAYMAPAGEIPVLRRKLRQVLQIQDVIEGSHDYKSIIQFFETFPKDDLFAMPVESLSETLGELVETEDTPSVRLFVRRDEMQRSVGALVTVPRDRFNANLRKQLQELFLQRFGGESIDYRLSLGESGDARIHFSVWTQEGAPLDVDIQELEKEVVALSRNWDDQVFDELTRSVDEPEARRLCDTWAPAFPEYYQASTALSLVAGDILLLDRLAASDADLVVGLQNEHGAAKAPKAPDSLTRITVYRKTGKLNLSIVMPLMEHLGLVVVEEVPTRLKNAEGTFIHDFGVLTSDGRQLDIAEVGNRIAAAIEAILLGEAESDSLQRLLVTTDLTHEDLTILRAYRSYWRLVTPAFSVGYVDSAFAAHPEIAEATVRLFQARFGFSVDAASPEELAGQITASLDDVASLDEDRILRGFLGLILATQRTNFLVEGRSTLALKFSSHLVPEMPEPQPLYEIYVYASDIEGIHLRGGMVARGGIRWSDRREDYRTEVLGLMKAQMTKNVVIVPTGAKGGFVVKKSAEPGRPTYEEVREGYKTFIRGLLDVTDNRVGDAVVPPPSVVRHDGDDPYLVVAADKGTASFSDTANALAAEYGFWLDDAFASGGSAGYDHKELGITARGAWESVRRHFLDLGIDVDEEQITAVGIGDMSGDVFGNGMLLSKHLKLVAAFDHRDIFVDPDPDPQVAWGERDRLFRLERSSWADYDRSLISEGGGVFSRSAKVIDLTPQMREVLGTDDAELTPNELIARVLAAPVDLLWNGGIGTYVKARSESSEVVQDRSNDAVRVNGRDLRCKVVGEGGNLGLTQRGRIEYERFGGQVFTDFIDNSGGVHASDREVNLKILLRIAESAGTIDREERDRIIESVSDDIVKFILYDNFLQAQIISQRFFTSARFIEAYSDLMDRLDRGGILNREIEFLPSTEEMAQRAREGTGMARPELAVLLAYAKRSLTDHLLNSTLPDDPHFETDLLGYFPPAVVERFSDEIRQHPLRRELISTIVANQVLNSQGSTFYSRLRTLTGASAASIVRAYRIARVVTNAAERWIDVEGLSGRVDPDTERMMLKDVDGLVTLVARWYLTRPSDRTIDEEIALARGDFARLSEGLPKMPSTAWQEPYQAVVVDLVSKGVPEDLAVRHAYQRALRRGPDMVDLAHQFDKDVVEVAALYTRSSDAFRIGWLERQIRLLPMSTTFDRLAIESLRDDLQFLRRDVVATVLTETDGSIEAFLEAHERVKPRLDRWYRWLSRDGIQDVSAGLIAVRRLRQLLIGN